MHFQPRFLVSFCPLEVAISHHSQKKLGDRFLSGGGLRGTKGQFGTVPKYLLLDSHKVGGVGGKSYGHCSQEVQIYDLVGKEKLILVGIVRLEIFTTIVNLRENCHASTHDQPSSKVSNIFFNTKYRLKSAEIILFAECKLLIMRERDDLQVESSHFFHGSGESGEVPSRVFALFSDGWR